MRIVSLLPSATESLFALGLGGSLVAVTHECDYPPEASSLPIVTRSTLRLHDKDSAGIETAVSEAAVAGRSLYFVDTQAIQELEPDLVVAQDVCRVCAVSADQVAVDLEGIRMIRQHPHSLQDVLADIVALAAACGADAEPLMRRLNARIEAVRRTAHERPPVRGVFLEWLDPPYPAGHWTPDLLALAGIEDPLARPGAPSVAISWAESLKKLARPTLRTPRVSQRPAAASSCSPLLTVRAAAFVEASSRLLDLALGCGTIGPPFDRGHAVWFEFFVDGEEVGDLGADAGREIVELVHLDPFRIVQRHAENLVVDAGLVAHAEDPERPYFDPAPRKGGLVDEHERVEVLLILGQRLFEEAVVGRKDDGRKEVAVELDHTALFVVLVLVAAPLRDLDEATELHSRLLMAFGRNNTQQKPSAPSSGAIEGELHRRGAV